MSHIHSASPIDRDGIVRCYVHNLPVAVRTSRTAGNPNRQFFCCPKDMGDPERCKFFLWADDPMLQKAEPSLQESRPVSSSPHASQRQRAAQARSSHIDSPVTPHKRSLSPQLASTATPEPTSSQKRLKIMQDAISESFPSTPISPLPSETRMTSFPSPVVKPSSIPGRSISIQTSQQKHFMDLPFIHSSSPIQKLNSPTPRFQDNIDDYDDVFLSTPPSSQPSRRPQYRVIDVPPDPSGTWMKGGIQDADEDRGNQSRSILTPPESFQRLGNSFAVDGRESFTPITPTKDKGKPRAHNVGTTQWQKIQDDPEHPFHERASFLRDPSQSQSQPLPRHLLEPTSGSMVSLLTNQQAELSADHIETLLQGLTTIPDYVRKLERKKIAAEKSNDAKARKIAELEGEVQKLRTTNRVLEETVGALKARWP